MRDSVVFYRSFFEAIQEEEDPVKRAQAYDAILAYALDDIEPEGLKGIGKAAFILARPQIDANNKKHRDGCKGGAPKGNQNAKKQPLVENENNLKQPPVVFENNSKQPNENENENENENVNEKIYVARTPRKKKPKLIKNEYGQYKHVKLTEEEYKRLGDDFGEEKREKMIRRFDEYMDEKPKYKSENHNLALRRWVRAAVEEDEARSNHTAAGQKAAAGMLTNEYDMAALEARLLGG